MILRFNRTRETKIKFITMIIAIDFDGTITKHNEFPEINEICPYCIDVLTEMISRGHKLVLNTMRSGIYLNDAVKFIESNGIKLYGVNYTPGQKSWTKSPKVYADIYIDDAALGIPITDGGYLDWKEIKRQLINKGY